MSAAAQQLVPAAQLSTEALTAAAWRAGDLSWKLDPHQMEIYDAFNAWNARRPTAEYVKLCEGIPGAMDDVWVEEIGRRFGKTAKWIVMLFEIAIRRPGAVLSYGTAFEDDIGEIIVPLARMLWEDAPEDCKPAYKGKYKEQKAGIYFPNGSMIKLVGVDKNPDGLRGRFSDGIVLSECGFMRALEELVRAVLIPQFQRRPWAFCALETSSPDELDHDFLEKFRPDAEARGAYVTRTIEDNVVLTRAEKDKWIRQAGGRGHPTCEREYFCILTRDPQRMIIPEYIEETHQRTWDAPQYADYYVAMDPGMSDRCAIVWAYWDFLRYKLVITRSWAEFNAGTDVVADAIRDGERKLGVYELKAWDENKRKLRSNPLMRVSDVDKRLIHDLRNIHAIECVPTAKDDSAAQVQALRNAFRQGQIVVLPDSGPLAAELKAGKRKVGGAPDDWERSTVYGHYDCIAALKYLWRNVDKTRNPFPPEGALLTGETVQREPWADYTQQSKSTRALNSVFGGGRVRR